MDRDVAFVLTEHHAVIRWLAGRLMSGSDSAPRAYLFNEFSKAVGGHLRGVDVAVLPALRMRGWRDIPSDLLVGHADLKHRFAAILALQDATARDRDLPAFVVKLADQRRREEMQLLPALRKLLDRPTRARLAEEVAYQFELILGEPARPKREASVGELIEEARVVLRALPVE